MRKILTTCALPYSNGEIHVGHLVEYLQADIWVRFQKMQGHTCLFFCADDTHGTPIMLAAKKNQITPERLVQEKKQAHIEDFSSFEINFTHYSDTNTKINQTIVNEVFAKMETSGSVVNREVEQAYCDTCKIFLPDRFIKGTCSNCKTPEQYGDSCDKCGATYAPLDMIDPYCVTCNKKPVIRTSDHLFFRLADFQDFLNEWVPAHTSLEVSHKLMEWFQPGLRDWNISRDKPYFGFEIPGYKDKFFYVWVDAPIGYIAAFEEWRHNQTEPNYKNYQEIWANPDWEIHHFIGKDIIYFHGLFWPTMLKVAGLSTPKQLHVHGFLTINGEKMSKSKNTFVNAKEYLKHFDPLNLRYYFFSKISPGLNDIDLNWNDFKEKVNGILVSKITNIASRCLQMLHKKLDGRLGKMSSSGLKIASSFELRADEITKYYEEREYAKAAIVIRDLAEETNRYLDQKAPWKMDAQDQQQRFEMVTVLTDGLNLFRLIAIYLTPVLPSYSEKVATFFNEDTYIWTDLKKRLQDQPTIPYEYLLKRIEDKNVFAMSGN